MSIQYINKEDVMSHMETWYESYDQNQTSFCWMANINTTNRSVKSKIFEKLISDRHLSTVLIYECTEFLLMRTDAYTLFGYRKCVFGVRLEAHTHSVFLFKCISNQRPWISFIYHCVRQPNQVITLSHTHKISVLVSLFLGTFKINIDDSGAQLVFFSVYFVL